MRARTRYVVLAAATIVVGLLVHSGFIAMSSEIRDVLGDALWATMMAWLVAATVPRARLIVRGATALVICYAVEFSQMIHTSTLDAIRSTSVGRLVLGSGFDPRDLLAYTAGVAVALLIERAFAHRTSSR